MAGIQDLKLPNSVKPPEEIIAAVWFALSESGYPADQLAAAGDLAIETVRAFLDNVEADLDTLIRLGNQVGITFGTHSLDGEPRLFALWEQPEDPPRTANLADVLRRRSIRLIYPVGEEAIRLMAYLERPLHIGPGAPTTPMPLSTNRPTPIERQRSFTR